MSPFEKEFGFKTENGQLSSKKLKNYFTKYNFKLREDQNNKIIFFKKFSFLQGWHINPLNWESEIVIYISDKIIKIKYTNYGNATITPFAFENLFNLFFNNLELYLTKSTNYELNNQTIIKKAKQKVLFHFLIIAACICFFILLGIFFKQEFNSEFLNKFGILIGAIFSLKLINQYWIYKKT